MKPTFQEKMDRAWPIFEKALARERASGLGKTLSVIKEAFIVRELHAAARQVFVDGKWNDAITEPGQLGTIVVTRATREYTPGVATGLKELVSSVVLSVDFLESSDVAVESAAVKLARAAIQQQIDYVVAVLLKGMEGDEVPAASAEEIMSEAHDALTAGEPARLTVLINNHTARSLEPGSPARKNVDSVLQDGRLLVIDNANLEKLVLVVLPQPDGLYWSSALDLVLGWDPSPPNNASIAILSRFLVQTPAQGLLGYLGRTRTS